MSAFGGDETSQFLSRIEESARSILRKNNAIGGNEVLSPKCNSNLSRNESMCGKSSDEEFNARLRPFGSNRKTSRKKALSKTKPEEVILDVATLRKYFRCDEYLILSKGGATSNANKRAPRPFGGERKDHTIQYLIASHVAAIAAKFDAMTQKRLVSMRVEVRDGFLNEMVQERIQCGEKIVKDDEWAEKLQNKDARDGSKADMVETGQRIGKVSKGALVSSVSEEHSAVLQLVKSKRLVPIVPPPCWTIVARESISNYSEIDNCRLFIHRIDGKGVHCWTIELFDRNECKESYILYDNEITSLVSSLSRFIPDDMFIEEDFKSNNGILVHQEMIKIIGESDSNADARIHVHQRGLFLLAVLSFQIAGDESGNDRISAELSIPIYEVIAMLGLHQLFEALNAEFWTSSSNEVHYIWRKLICRIDVEINLEGDRGLVLIPRWNEKHGGDLSRAISIDNRYKDILKVGNDILYLMRTESGLRNVADALRQEVFQDKVRIALKVQMKEMMDHGRPLSLQLSQHYLYNESLIPGACSFGEVGSSHAFATIPKNVFDSDVDFTDSTQAALIFDRRGDASIVTTRLALESPVSAPIFHIFDSSPRLPEPSCEIPVQGPIPLTMAQCGILLEEKLISPVDTRMLPGIISIDGRAMDPCEGEEIGDCCSSTSDPNIFFSKEFFRRRCVAQKIDHNSRFPLHKFGISHDGLLPNATGVGERVILYSEEVCTHLLSEERGSEDFFHMMKHEFSGKDGGSPNDPLISIIHMEAYKTKEVKGIKMKEHLERERQKSLYEEEKKRQEILELKMEAADCIMHSRLAKIGSSVQSIQRKETASPKIVESSVSKGRIPHTDKHRVSKGNEWRDLRTSIVGVNLFDLGLCKVGQYDISAHLYQPNKPRMVGVITASNATSYVLPDDHFQTSTKTEFVDNLLADRFHLSHQIETARHSTDIILNTEQQYALEHILKVPLQSTAKNLKVPIEIEENYGVPKGSSALEPSDGRNMSNEVLTIQAIRHANVGKLEEMLDDLGVDIDTADEYGNTLLLLTAQQGNKKLCKFLLRRGAYINAQNHSGNTVLHYLHKYDHLDLADYMRRKGADDSYLNSDGLTCYEASHI